ESGHSRYLHSFPTRRSSDLASADREAQRLQSEMAVARAQAENFGGERGQLAIEFETVSQRVDAMTQEIAQIRELLELKRKEESRSEEHTSELQSLAYLVCRL